MVASGTVAVLPRIVAGWATGDVQGTLLPDKVLGSNIDGPVNVLLLGIDQRSGNTTELIRTDTMIIVHIPATHDKAYLGSVRISTAPTTPAADTLPNNNETISEDSMALLKAVHDSKVDHFVANHPSWVVTDKA
jgi:hypothetical protein